jgi:hypothetical protein
MAFYPPPDEILPIFNPANFQTQGNTGDEDIPFLTQYFLRFPTSQGSETVAGTLVSQFQITANTNIVMDGTAGTNYLEFPDGTQQYTASAGGNPTNLLSSNNNWIGNQTWNGTNSLATGATTLAPADGDNGTAVPTTAWVNTAIQTALTNITPSTGNRINQNFTGAVISTVYSIPADADNFSIALQGVGGYAGAPATDIPITPPNTTDFTLYSGGQGGGAIGNASGTILNSTPLNTGAGLAGQLLTLSCSGNGTGTNVELSWTNSITGLPMVVSVPNGGNGANATSSSAGGGGAGALASAFVQPPAFVGSFFPITIDGQNGSPGASFAFNSGTPSTSPPYAGLTPAYDPTQLAGMPQNQQFALLPGTGTGSGSQGYGQLNQAVFTSADKIYTNSNGVFYGYGASPIGTGNITISWTVGDPKQLGGTNSSFIAYDDPDPAVKTKQIYTDKEGLVVSQDLTTSYKTTTLTPTNLTQDLNGVVSTALIADIIAITNSGTNTLQQVLDTGNTAIGQNITLQDTTNPTLLLTQMTEGGFFATDNTASPNYLSAYTSGSAILTNSNGDSNTIQSGQITIDNPNSATVYSIAEISAGNEAISVDYRVGSNQLSSTGYSRLDLTSGDLTSQPPRAVLQAFVDLNALPTYLPNINLIDLGGATGEEILIANGNNSLTAGTAYNTIQMFSDSGVSSSFIQVQSLDASTGLGTTLLLGQQLFVLEVNSATAFSIGSVATDAIVFRRNISLSSNTSSGLPVGLLENSVINATTTGTTTLTTSNAFATIINTPTAGTRIFVLPAPTAGTAGYWYAICNKSTAFTIAVQYPALTTIFTIPVATNATNGGSVAKFAVVAGGASYFTV